MRISRSAARETAFVLLFEYIIKGNESASEIWENAVELPTLKDVPYTKDAYFGCVENKEKIDALVEKCLVGWKKERLSYVSRAILALAVYEMMFVEDVPYKVAINEAIELSKRYDEESAHTFINGVLNAAAVELGLKGSEG